MAARQQSALLFLFFALAYWRLFFFIFALFFAYRCCSSRKRRSGRQVRDPRGEATAPISEARQKRAIFMYNRKAEIRLPHEQFASSVAEQTDAAPPPTAAAAASSSSSSSARASNCHWRPLSVAPSSSFVSQTRAISGGDGGERGADRHFRNCAPHTIWSFPSASY